MIFYNIKSSKLPVKDNKTVELPNDYINYTKIGVFNNKGEVIPLKYNSKLSNFADLLPDRLQKHKTTLYLIITHHNQGYFIIIGMVVLMVMCMAYQVVLHL